MIPLCIPELSAVAGCGCAQQKNESEAREVFISQVAKSSPPSLVLEFCCCFSLGYARLHNRKIS